MQRRVNPRMALHPWQSQLIMGIISALFDTHERIHQNSADRLIQACAKDLAEDTLAITYAGEHWVHSSILNQRGSRTFVTIPKSQEETATYLLRAQKKMRHEKQAVKQTLSQLLLGVSDAQAFRNEIPECVLDCCPPAIRELPRTKAPSWEGRASEALDLINYYSAARLLV